MDVELLGAWNGVAAVLAHRHYIARVQGQPLNIGVFVDETYDIGRIENVGDGRLEEIVLPSSNASLAARAHKIRPQVNCRSTSTRGTLPRSPSSGTRPPTAGPSVSFS